MLSRLALSVILVSVTSFLPTSRTRAQDDTETASPRLIDFIRDVEPVLKAKCLECHGPDEAKNDFRVDDPEWMLEYVEAGDLESSSLWTDYLVTDDPDMKMPPADKPALTGAEYAAIKLWIEEGADWPETAFEPEVAGEEQAPAAAPAEEPKSLAARIWLFQGLFHPASVHFPIALLTVSALFCFLSFFSRSTFEPAAFHCLWIGALGAVAASVMGWGYAQYEGYGSGFSFDLAGRAIDRHRWLGIVVAIGAVALVGLARSVRKSTTGHKRGLWFLASLGLLLAVSITGYQGGELTYGEDHYQKEFARLFPETAESTSAAEPGEDTDEPSDDSDALNSATASQAGGEESGDDEPDPAEVATEDSEPPAPETPSTDTSDARESESTSEAQQPAESSEPAEPDTAATAKDGV